MFNDLSQKLTLSFKRLRGLGRLTEEDINVGLREVRLALLEADVALPVVRDFIQHVREKSINKAILRSITPGQALIKIVHEELISLMGSYHQPLNINTTPPAVILLAGLQGAGKTTTVAKLGCWIKDKKKKRVAVVSCDIYRPAAIKQLQILAEKNQLVWIESDKGNSVEIIAQQAMEVAKRQLIDVLIIDSAGRLHIDSDMMNEIRLLYKITAPVETLFVIDSMMGQDAVNAAAAFNADLPLTGAILTKTDGDARGGVALTVKQTINQPIKFIGTGEKPADLSAFYPERVASQILGMGDVLSVVEEVQEHAAQEKNIKFANKVKKGVSINLEDFRTQLQQINNIGWADNLLGKLPIMNKQAVASGISSQINGDEFKKSVAIIDSMTRKERALPSIINGKRKKRIAGGSGTQVQDINRLLKQFKQMQKMIKKMSGKAGKSNLNKLMQNLKI